MKPLKCTVIQKWSGIDQSHPAIQLLDEIVSWRVTPPFNRIGRSSWLPLKEPIVVQGPGGPIYVDALKIKGVGFLDSQGNVNQPTTDALRRIEAHLGISEDVRFSIVAGSHVPIGGITLDKALAEYNVACALTENGISSSVPIRVYQYHDPELRFQGVNGEILPTGVVVTGQLQRNFNRLSAVLNYSDADDTTKTEINNFAESMDVTLDNDPELSIMRACYRSYGHHIRNFSKCGYYRHSAHWDNLGLSLRAGDIYFTDIDSCRELAECSELVKPMQVMRDALSSVCYFILGFSQKQYFQSFPPERVIQAELQQAFLTSYYDDLPIELINALIDVLNECHVSFYQQVVAGFAAPAKKGPDTSSVSDFQKDYDNFADAAFWTAPWLNHAELYCWLLAVMWTLHSRSQMSTLYPFKLTEDDFYIRISDFSTPQLVETIRKRINQAVGQ